MTEAATHLWAWHQALSVLRRNGQTPTLAQRRAVLSLALDDPVTALRSKLVMQAVPAEHRATVLRLADRASVTAVAAGASQPARSIVGRQTGPFSVSQAARALRITPHGVRAACRRGRLRAAKDGNGRWLISAADVEVYADG